MVLPMERAVNIVMVAFVIFEVIQGYRVIKAMTEHQVSKFHLHQFDDLSELHDTQERQPEEIGFRT